MNEIAMLNLVDSIKKIVSPDKRNTMLFGEVVSVEPLKIDIGNNVVLSEKFLFLGQNCRPHKVTIPHNHLIDTYETNTVRAIKTTEADSGAKEDIKKTYITESQEIKRITEKGTNERTLITTTHENVDMGGTEMKLTVNVDGSSTSDMASVTGTSDNSTLNIDKGEHKHVIPKFVTQDVHFPNSDYEDSVTIEIYPRLHVGDIVLMFAFNQFQMYYVAERIEKDK